jgi:hypothetical protein
MDYTADNFFKMVLLETIKYDRKMVRQFALLAYQPIKVERQWPNGV